MTTGKQGDTMEPTPPRELDEEVCNARAFGAELFHSANTTISCAGTAMISLADRVEAQAAEIQRLRAGALRIAMSLSVLAEMADAVGCEHVARGITAQADALSALADGQPPQETP